MSSEFYFRKWKKALAVLEATVKKDVEYQETKAHDKKRCEATERLSSVLSEYMYIYNQVWDCLHQNLQVQKTIHINDVLKAVLARILELKHELRKLEVSEYHFFCNGLVEIKLTTDDVELLEIPHKVERPEHVQVVLDEIFEKCKEKKKLLEEEDEKSEEVTENANWWDSEFVEEEEKFKQDSKKYEPTLEEIEIKKNIEIIQAHERSRQLIQNNRQQYMKRLKWENELSGTSNKQAPLEIRENSAKLIQKVFRIYFQLKREKQMQRRRDEILGLRPCRAKGKLDYKEKLHQVEIYRARLRKKYEEDLRTDQEKIKQDLLKRKSDEIREDYRDKIRDWFKEWYEAINMFHEIPDESKGGAALILKDDLPSPHEWLEEYKAYLALKIANKNKTTMELKYEKMEAKREIMMQRKEEKIKNKLEEQLRKKMMKNPTLHPGFNYPESKKTGHILEVLEHYHKEWAELDATEATYVKQRYVHDINKDTAYMHAKLDVIPTVDEDMRMELKLLNAALKKDYENYNEKMPESMKKTAKKGKKKRKVKKTISENIADKLEGLVFQGFVREYPKTKLEEFIGDPNFSGGDLRSNYGIALPFNGETRNVWWEQCRELTHGFHRILLVGPRGGGKMKLVHILASMNNAVLFELDVRMIRSELMAAIYFDQLVSSVAACAKAVQPSVIHIKHVQKLYFKKVPPEDAEIDWELIKNYFVKKLFKKIHKTDRITIIGSCIEPWATKGKQMLKQFPTVVLLPNASYSTVVQMLSEWVHRHPVIPAELDISSLAHVLQGYSFGFVKDSLTNFLTPDRIVRIAARGLSPTEVYDFFLEDNTEKVNYEKYQKWYLDKTSWGQKEKKHLEEQIEFRKAVEDWAQKTKKKKNIASAASSVSSMKT